MDTDKVTKENGNLPIFRVRQRYLKNCIGCGKFVKKKQWVKADNCKDGGGALCFECIGNVEQTSRD
jgi:hypothetical protein